MFELMSIMMCDAIRGGAGIAGSPSTALSWRREHHGTGL
jgi:hypothetical protein